MISARQRPSDPAHRSFRARLLLAIMLLISGVTALSLYIAQRSMAAEVERDLQQEFQGELARSHVVQEVRRAALAERCRALVRRPRIHAALEDNALDLLYPSAKDELRDVLADEDQSPPEPLSRTLRARFYRFLDATGSVIASPSAGDVGALRPEEEVQLSLGGAPEQQQTGYLVKTAGDGTELIDEVIAMPIVSTETGEVIAALVLGFEPVELRADTGMTSGLWLNDRLHFQSLSPEAQTALGKEMSRAISISDQGIGSSLRVQADGTPHLLFFKRLNPGSVFPPAYEVCLYPLASALVRQRQVLWQIMTAGGMLLLGGLVVSHFVSGRFSAPVEKLAVTSEENRAQRERAEAALEVTSEELQRSARFSADASHQLKTPVTVMRAGLEELLAQEQLPPETSEEISGLIHQTYRLGSIIEDLLLLSRMDAGHLQLDFAPVNLSHLIEAWLDDFSVLSDDLGLAVETDFPADLYIAGEARYTSLILQNLLENARKYNHRSGRIRIAAREENGQALLTIGNTGSTIPFAAQDHIFERFHRGAMGENVPGHGLGLNLARQLARLHGGDLRIIHSSEDWTEFEVRFRPCAPAQIAKLTEPA